ncbi:C40 family peptidase [Riemerella anatipestifer]|uniref:Cell wall-associated hydrolases (Invasion-associated proteins) n=1 Tax=Riemerella anatipestifer RA-CH-1 TaxID=1228997 RepID=J9QXT4_RIEAN|nr:C40 family peptidase [Riemerella anatipestifer]AFR35130.1 Cell wall-associated hydrolases (invasion-associated proteins) [Riemerella anatipestifer RA-CH-1]AIH02148.1 nlp/p60 protein [Riemerella anatipestifer CH3]MCO7332201.1 C40 family peptidase [Riemerella anatipestifer]MCO7350966.1 C40 family peptidase [Riemerella anatipestifer]MCU7581841.1 C40 family peptidase [Riemerella anatipestifer]
MSRAVASVSVVPVRSESSDKAEIITQVLYGESVEILSQEGNWVHIKIDFDGYEGWVDVKQFKIISDENISESKTNLVKKPFLEYGFGDEKLLLSIGSEIEADVEETEVMNIRSFIADTAQKFLNVPYLWGGRSFFGIDCSGFTQIVYKVGGIKIPRDAYQQAEVGQVLDFIEEAQAGDLAFFENEEGRITHVGIMLEDRKIIHAHGKVRIDELDSVGIFNKDQNKHTHKLRFIKTLL